MGSCLALACVDYAVGVGVLGAVGVGGTLSRVCSCGCCLMAGLLFVGVCWVLGLGVVSCIFLSYVGFGII